MSKMNPFALGKDRLDSDRKMMFVVSAGITYLF